MLLVVTNKSDLACDFLILRLKERNIPFLRLNTEDYGESFQVDISLAGSEASYEISFDDGRVVADADIGGVYFRQPLAPNVSSDVAEADRAFVQRESKEILRSLWRLIDQRRWLNHPKDLWLASNKVEQLSIAQELGFDIPPTHVSSSESAVRSFIENHEGPFVCKAVKHGFLREESSVRVATTQRVGPEFLGRFEDYASVPMIFQEEIRKAFDVRVTVVGNSVFATAIYSQEHPQTSVDWRVWDTLDFDLRHEAIKLPKYLEALCRQITGHFNLKYSAIDLVKADKGEYFFLELNPNGQWAWIEQKVGYSIRDALIDCLGF